MSTNTSFPAVLLLLAVAVGAAQPGPGRGTSPAGSAQAAISGFVYDSDLEVPVEYATVILYRLADSSQVAGTVTGVDGRFSLQARPGQYYLEVSFIGYHTRVVDEVQVAASARINLGRLGLRQAVVAVKGAEVVADRPTLTYQIDKKIIDVGRLTTAASGTAVDVLENAPSVKVDVEGNVSLRGSGNFTVLIDNQPSPLEGSEALQQIPAATIDRVEIITNPSAKYDPEGVSGIINVILKKQRKSGVSGVASLDAGWPLRLGGNLLVSYRAERLSLFGGGNFRNGRFPGTRAAETWTVDSTGDTTFSKSEGDGTRQHRFYGLRAGGEFRWTGSDRTSLSARYGGRGFGMTQDAVYRRWVSPGTGDTSLEVSRDSSLHGGDFLSVSLDQVHTFPGREGHQLVVSAQYRRMGSDDRSVNLLIDSISGDTLSGRRDRETGPRQPASLKLDYSLPLRKEDKFEAGASATLHNALSKQETWEYAPSADSYEQTVNYTETRPAAYVQYAGKFGPFGLQPGFRVEYADRTVDAGDSGVFEFKRWDWFPTLHASFDLPADNQLMASYTRRIRRQRGWQLWPFITRMDAYNLRRGNPDLRPEMTDAVEFGWQRPFGASRVSLEAYYRVTHDKVERIRTVFAPGVILHSVANVGTDYALGAELATELVPVKWWTIDLSADVYDYRMAGSIGNSEFDNSSFSWETRASMDFKLPTQTRLTLTGRYESPEVSAQGIDEGHLRTDAAIRQAFLNRQLVVTLQARDLLGTGGHESTSEGDGFYSHFRFTRQSPMLSLNVTWNFNNYRPDRRRQEDNGLELEDNGGEEY
jgi:outer membrane receptor protein involved in Fe transport